MPRPNPKAASSGWGWSAEGPPALPSRPQRPSSGSGTVGAVIAAIAFVGVLGAGGVAFLLAGDDDEPRPDATAQQPAASRQRADEEPQPGEPKPEARAAAIPVTLDEIAWTLEAPSSLHDAAAAWSIPRSDLARLNPAISRDESLQSGTALVVYASGQGESASIGPPNDGRLINGVPLPEGRAWSMPEDRTRAFATSQTIRAVTAALQAYGRRFPGAPPLQIGDLSARRGGPIYGHQSHQTGRDIDIRLVLDDAGEGFDPERNWVLVKALIDGGPVREIFLNRTEQAWLREAAEADVGSVATDAYFSLIDHEPGHTIHMHIRYDCPGPDTRCVGYSMPDTDENDGAAGRVLQPSRKSGGASKLPGAGAKPKPSAKKKRLTKKKR